MSLFSKATRKKAKLRLALCGTSGSGKTYSALLIAKGLGGRAALIDTENGSGSLYEHLGDYDVAEIKPPFTAEKYIAAINEAEKEGYSVLIIDSLSHAWAGQGGILEEVDKRKGSNKNSFTAWRDVTPMHNKLIDTMLQSQLHIIVTMRSKTAYEMEKDEKGKVVPVKMGMAPIQRDGLEYEFTVVLDMENSKHTATAGKDRTGLFDGKVLIPSTETGTELLLWLGKGVDEKATDQQISQIWSKAKQSGLSGDDVKAIMKFKYNVEDKAILTMQQASEMMIHLNDYWDEVVKSKSSKESAEDDAVLEDELDKVLSKAEGGVKTAFSKGR